MGRPGCGKIFCGHGHRYQEPIEAKKYEPHVRKYRWTLQKNRPLTEAHVGLGVTDKEFDIVAGHLGTTLQEFKVPPKEYDELMTKVGSLRSYVVEARIKK